MALLSDKVAVVTGSTRGLGLAIAEAYAKEGAAIVVSSRSAQAVAAATARLKAAGARAEGLAIDVGRLAEVEALAQHAIHSFGKIDIWINNAGIAGPYGPTVDLAPDAVYRVIQTNIMGVYNGSRTALTHFAARRNGKLINLLGHGYKKGMPWQNSYGSSKAWVHAFTMALATETAGSGVGVFAFSPGMVLTDLLTDVDVVSGSEERLQRFPMVLRMWAQPPEVAARKAVWLASPATDGKTGLLVNVLSPRVMLTGIVREGLRSLLRQPASAVNLRVNTIPSFRP